MKTIKSPIFIILLTVLLTNITILDAQEKKDTVTSIVPTISFSYLNLSNDSIVLTANLFVKKDQGVFAIQNAVIEFIAKGGNESKKIGQAITDDEGNAIIKVYAKTGLPLDKEGKSIFTAKFSTKGKYLSASESISAKQAKLSVNFSKVDSVRYILVTATQVDSKGMIKPIGKIPVTINVPRLFTPLKIGEITLEEDGTGKFEYPGNIVGDSVGNIIVIAKIEENDLFGNVQGQSSISWGIPKQYYLAEMPTRELWTPIAPLWMIVTLITMLTGVWAHYIYAIIQLVFIKRSSRPKKL